MSIYRHKNIILNLSGATTAMMYIDDVLIFKGNTKTTIKRFIEECNNPDVTYKFKKYVEYKHSI
jgi:hypothetical protein